MYTGLQFLAINDLEGIKTVELGTDPEDSSDGFSDPIYFRGGFPVGTSTETVAHVCMIIQYYIAAIQICMIKMAILR